MLYNESKSHCPPCPPPPPKQQAHVHEIQGSVEIAEIKKPYFPEDKKDSYCYEEKKDPYYDCSKGKNDPYYDYDEEKKDPYYECEKSKKKPCYDYDEEKMEPNYDEHKKDPHKRCPKEDDAHNHRFAVVSGEAIPVGCKDHYHEVKFRTDFYEDHFHVFVGKTGGAIRVGDRHVHFLESQTSVNDGHRHDFRVATLIEDPIGD